MSKEQTLLTFAKAFCLSYLSSLYDSEDELIKDVRESYRQYQKDIEMIMGSANDKDEDSKDNPVST